MLMIWTERKSHPRVVPYRMDLFAVYFLRAQVLCHACITDARRNAHEIQVRLEFNGSRRKLRIFVKTRGGGFLPSIATGTKDYGQNV